jgi:hypothetical protein
MTTERNIIIHAGQTFTLSLDYAGAVGRGQRMHIRASDAAADVIAILTHNGDANARVIYDGTDSLDITIGASVNGGWLVGANRVEWVYDIEDYDLSDTDDVVIAHRGKVIVYGNRTRPEDVTPSIWHWRGSLSNGVDIKRKTLTNVTGKCAFPLQIT